VVDARGRVGARRGALFGAAVVDAEAELRVDAFRVAGLRFVVAGLAVLAARRAGRAGAPVAALRAICRTCLLSPSMRFSAFSTSACLAVLRIWTWSWSIAVFSVFWPSLIERSTCRRTSVGTRLSACRNAFRPALTARPTRLDCLDRDVARFLVAKASTLH
jgi:hypothetical protein